jgi:hypothetical protein
MSNTGDSRNETNFQKIKEEKTREINPDKKL